MKQRVSFFVHDLANNPVGRTIALANALKPLYDVEILGFLISGDEVYRPYRGLFEYKTIRIETGLKSLMRQIKPLASMASGDIIYACKPLITSFVPALVAAGLPKRRPLFLDIDDTQWGDPTIADVLRDPFGGLRDIDGWGYTRLLHPFTWRLDGTTVVSTDLQKRYGGVLLRHGPDESEFDPARADLTDAARLRRKFHLPENRKLLLFAGTPRGHKGIPTLLEALQRPECQEWDLALVAPPEHPEVQEAVRILQNRCHVLGFVSYTEMPAILAAVDAVPLPQMAVRFAQSQVPAKLLDAMSMAKPIAASRVGDLGEILGEGQRGWVVSPGSPVELAQALREISTDAGEAARRGRAARQWFLEEASGSAIRRKLQVLFEGR